jgi:hypothetical protein
LAAIKALGGAFGQLGGLAQGGGIAGAAGQFAPDEGGLELAAGRVLGADPAGGDGSARTAGEGGSWIIDVKSGT